jgi:hypothetical protein
MSHTRTLRGGVPIGLIHVGGIARETYRNIALGRPWRDACGKLTAAPHVRNQDGRKINGERSDRKWRL